MTAEDVRRPSVSVVIPTYRHRDFVLATLDSVFAQTFTDYEVIVINDGSSDDTAELLRPLAVSGRIRYIEQANVGQATSRNRGIHEARGEFIALLDDDDLWPPDKLQWQVEALRARSDVNVACGWLDCIDGSGRPAPRFAARGLDLPWLPPEQADALYGALTRRNQIVSPGQCLIRRSALAALTGDPFDTRPALKGCDDWDLWLRLAEGGRFLFVNQLALRYRVHGGNASRDVFQMHRGMTALYKKHLGRSRDDANRHRHLVAGYQAACTWAVHDLLAHIRQEAARGNVTGAVASAAFLARTYTWAAAKWAPRALWHMAGRTARSARRWRR